MAEAESSDPLTDAYRCLVAQSRPNQSAADLAAAVFSAVCGDVSGGPAGVRDATRGNVISFSMCLVNRIVVSAPTVSAELSEYLSEVLRVLFQDLDLMLKLLYHFQSEDQFVSHQAAKCVSACVVYHLRTSVTLSPMWQQKYADVFQRALPGPELDCCLWSLSDILKKLLKGLNHEMVGNLLAGLDYSLCVLSSTFLSMVSYICSSTKRQWNMSFCIFLDLLEILYVSGMTCETSICLESQRIVHTRSSFLLTAISMVYEYFVSKKVALLLKRAMLQKLGDDLSLGGQSMYKDFTSDRSVLSLTVLSQLESNWLETVEVKPEAFFGGIINANEDAVQNPDWVMVRAVSLIVLKSIELHVQTSEGADSSLDAGLHHTTKADRYLKILWCFLRRRSTRLAKVTHLCSWVSLLFGEQDDDMMEAARALLAIFLNRRQHSRPDDPAAMDAMMDAACTSGCNPHCNFLFLLQSVFFHHSILMDFLISSETCFLEYLVRYLKFLLNDRPGFMAACKRFGESHGHIPKQQPVSNEDEKSVLTSEDGPKKAEASSTGSKSPQMTSNMTPVVHLVNYDSSDESTPENIEVSEAHPGPLKCKTSEFDSQDTETSRLPTSVGQKRYPSLLFPNDLDETSRTKTAPRLGNETSTRVLRCLSKLKKLMTKLHVKKLFPYNPTSLLRLLGQVENLLRLQ